MAAFDARNPSGRNGMHQRDFARRRARRQGIGFAAMTSGVELMSTRLIEVFAVVAVLAGAGCGGGSTGTFVSGSGPTSPTTGGVTIDILSSNGLANLGAASFSPNPASVGQGMTVVWHNGDSITHHIVLDDGGIDTGSLAPGATSSAMTLSSSNAGATYHCTIHPSMVGSINMATTSTMPGTGY
jgi:plastocyanin